MGGPLGVFIRDLLEPLPFYIKPIVTVIGLMFVWWCLVIVSGMRIWTWFFTIEPAVTAQHQVKPPILDINIILNNKCV